MTDLPDSELARDVAVLERLGAERRRALRWLAGAGGFALAGHGSACPAISQETAGPFPADGSNIAGGRPANALVLPDIVRSDIRNSMDGATGSAAGAPLVLTLRLVDARQGCAGLAGYAVYLWHCDREGRYSMYSPGVMDQNYLRGVQVTGSDGSVSFTTVFPGCYDGRMPHMHFEVYRSAGAASTFQNAVETSQIAFPVEVCRSVYAHAAGYSASAARLARMSFAADMVFADGVSTQMALVSGDVSAGYVADLAVGISG